MVIIGLEGEPHIELQRSIRSVDEPVVAALQYHALELRTFETAALDQGDTTFAERCFAEQLDLHLNLARW